MMNRAYVDFSIWFFVQDKNDPINAVPIPDIIVLQLCLETL